MVTTGFADRGLFGAETESARKGLPRRSISVVECDCSGADATPSPSRRGLKPLLQSPFSYRASLLPLLNQLKPFAETERDGLLQMRTH